LRVSGQSFVGEVLREPLGVQGWLSLLTAQTDYKQKTQKYEFLDSAEGRSYRKGAVRESQRDAPSFGAGISPAVLPKPRCATRQQLWDTIPIVSKL
jgi:hypothetical protein